MKDFKDNLDEESIDRGDGRQEGFNRFASSTPSRTFAQKAVQVLSRYSLLIIVGLAALSITLLHFQGKYLLQALRGTPLPTFWLEKVITSSVVPDKTEVYEKVLAEEAKDAWQKRSRGRRSAKIAKPQWQASYSIPKAKQDSVVVDTVEKKPPSKRQHTAQKKRPRNKPTVAVVPLPAEERPSFFQPVKAVSSPVGNTFLSCVVHGDQEVGNRKRMVLRLTEAATVNGKEVPAGTLVYGMARLAQDRIQVVISRIGPQPVSYRVHDHTYHEGIVLDERNDVVQDAAKETVYRQGHRRTNQLPTQVASDLARDLLQRVRRKKQSVFLPDGYPLYISGRHPAQP